MPISRTEQAVGVCSALLAGGALVAFQRGLLTTREQRIGAVAAAAILALVALTVLVHWVCVALTAGRVTLPSAEKSRRADPNDSDPGDADVDVPLTPRGSADVGHSVGAGAGLGAAPQAPDDASAPPQSGEGRTGAVGSLRRGSLAGKLPPPARPYTPVLEGQNDHGGHHGSAKPTTPLASIAGGDTPEGVTSPPVASGAEPEPRAALLPPATSAGAGSEVVSPGDLDEHGRPLPPHLRGANLDKTDSLVPQAPNLTIRADAGASGQPLAGSAGPAVPPVHLTGTLLQRKGKNLGSAQNRQLRPAPKPTDGISVFQARLQGKFAQVNGGDDDFEDD